MLNDQKFKFKFVDLLLRADAISCSLFLPILFESLKNSMPYNFMWKSAVADY